MKTSLSLLLAMTIVSSAATKIEEQIVAPPWQPGTMLTLSPKGMHVASMHKKDGKFFVSLDGVESPPYDDVLMAAPTMLITYQDTGAILGVDIKERGPVAFSPDGKRYAYAARSGDEVMVILDGKEIFRAKYSLSAPPVQLMQFTPDSRHLYFYNPSGDTLQSCRLMMDGKPVTPAFDKTPPVLFSTDGSHWLLHAGKAKQPAEKMIIVDGKVADFTGEMPRFMPDGKRIVCINQSGTESRLLLDGKPVLTRNGESIESFKISATGDIFAIVKHGAGETDLYRDGKLVENAAGTWHVVLSPDGKHWAARGQSNMGVAHWVMLDGKKGPDFKAVAGIAFSPDSNVCIYMGERDDGWHLVTNGGMDPQGYGVLHPAFAKTGHSLIYSAGPQPLAVKVFHNGKVSDQHRNVFKLEFSPNGERFDYYAPVNATTAEFIVDGEAKGFGGAFGEASTFSPDSQHLAAIGRTATSGSSLYVDGHFYPDRLPLGLPQAFTPDSKHLISRYSGPGTNQMPVLTYYLDGEPVAIFSGRPVPWVNSPKMARQVQSPVPFGINPNPPDPNAVDWEVQPDGSLIFVGSDSGPNGYGNIKLVHVTPDPGSNFQLGLAKAETDYQKSLADAEAAKVKAAEDAKAARIKAQQEAAAAAEKRKADYAAAVAAKQKARQDAIKLKGLNIQRARQGLPPLKELPPD